MRRPIDRLRAQAGFTYIEVLVAMGVMIAVMGGALAALDVFQSTTRVNGIQNDAQDAARTSVDRLVRELRNLASPTDQAPQAIDRAEPFDLVFQTVAPTKPAGSLNARNIERVRYCLSGDRKLYRQVQTWTTQPVPGAPADTACPGAGWDDQHVVAHHLSNRAGAAQRPVWLFDSSDRSQITTIRGELFIDADPSTRPGEVRLLSGVYLRNQNRAPTAAFSATVLGSPSRILLNGSSSVDPEDKPLTYTWYDGNQQVGNGVTFEYQPTLPNPHRMTLKVVDPAGLSGTSPEQRIDLP